MHGFALMISSGAETVTATTVTGMRNCVFRNVRQSSLEGTDPSSRTPPTLIRTRCGGGRLVLMARVDPETAPRLRVAVGATVWGGAGGVTDGLLDCVGAPDGADGALETPAVASADPVNRPLSDSPVARRTR